MVRRFAQIAVGFRILAAGLTLLAACDAAPAKPRVDDPKNAASWYAKSIAAWQQFKQNNPQQYELLVNYAGDSSQPITPQIRAALTGVQGVFGDFRKGSQQEYCDFALDYSQGFELLLPHLGEMRGIAKAMRADAAVRLADGDTSGAAAEYASMYKTSGHFGDDRVLISSLVGQAVFAFADAGVQAGLDSAAFNAADAASLLGGAKQLGADDPFQYVEAVGMEQEIALATLDKYRGPDGMKMLGELVGDSAMADKLSSLDETQFDADLVKYDDMMTRVNGVFAMTDKDAAMAEMQKIEADIASGGAGVLAQALAPALGKVLERKFAGEQMIADRIEVLRKLATGEQKPEEAANAALWYLRAIEMWEALPRETRATILAFDETDVAAKPGQDVIAALVDVQPIIDVVRDASIKRRCDFAAFVHHRGLPAVVPHYAPGLHELLRAAQADANRLQAAGDAAGAVDRYAIILRATGHMGGDANLAVCRAAQTHFDAVIASLEAANATGALDVRSPAAASLVDAAARVSRSDPFGYLAALKKTRDEIIGRFNVETPRATQDDLARWGAQVELIRTFNADQVMFALVLLDERMRRMIADPPAKSDGAAWVADDITVPESIDRMAGVMDAQAEQAVRAMYDDLWPRMAADDWALFRERPATPIARLNEGLARSRGDLRRATSLLLVPVHSPADDDDAPQATGHP